jgi:hypothetical protein
VRTAAPVYRERVRHVRGGPNRHARLVLPLSDDGQTVTGLLLARVRLEPPSG